MASQLVPLRAIMPHKEATQVGSITHANPSGHAPCHTQPMSPAGVEMPHEVATLSRAAQIRQRAEATVVGARAALASAIVDAHYSGIKQADIARITGYTRESVRRIVKAFEAETKYGPTA